MQAHAYIACDGMLCRKVEDLLETMARLLSNLVISIILFKRQNDL